VPPDRIDDEVVVRRIVRVDCPAQPMRIAQSIGPDFFSRALNGNKWIVVRNDSGRFR
jgi:hypothetical protein